MPDRPTDPDPLATLTWDDLVAWAGHRTLARGRALCRKGEVCDLARTDDGALLAEVLRLEVTVRSEGPSCDCSCSGEEPCEHAVAAVLEYQTWVEAGREVPTRAARSGATDAAPTPPAAAKKAPGEAVASERAVAAPVAPLRVVSVDDYLDRLDESGLRALLGDLRSRVDGVAEYLMRRVQAVSGDAPGLLEDAREAMEEALSERGWSRSWSDRSYTPDYGAVTECFWALVDAGRSDELLILGLELLEAGGRQVEESDDEGETAEAIAAALAAVWEALSHCSLTPAQRILWMYDRMLDDPFDLVPAPETLDIWRAAPEVWNEVAEALLLRSGLRPDPAGGPPEEEYGEWALGCMRRWAVDALAAAGRVEEAIALATGEAQGDVRRERTMELLIEAGWMEEAKALAREGIRQSAGRHSLDPVDLRERLRDIVDREGDAAMATALTADGFTESPSLANYRALHEAAERLDLWPAVRAACLAYLETGRPPQEQEGWPLPDTDCSPTGPRYERRFPATGLLIEVALHEGDRDKAVALYGLWGDGHPWGTRDLELRLAEEVASSHPDTAVAVWRGIAEACIGEANRDGYERSVPHLRRMQTLLRELGRGNEWDQHIAELRRVNKRRWACIQTLEVLDREESGKG